MGDDTREYWVLEKEQKEEWIRRCGPIPAGRFIAEGRREIWGFVCKLRRKPGRVLVKTKGV